MSNIDKITSISNYCAVGQEQLFTELTPEEAAVIEGGVNYSLGNQSGIDVEYDINGQKKSLAPNEDVTYSFSQSPVVFYPNKIGSEPNSLGKLVEGENNFALNGDYLILTNKIGPNPIETT
ncbi:MAG: hypothetical protein V7L25_02410 [Nostoc sp.]|uniref:hypothetical protein n=1 Tax=Nostoc sp. TaxID=1180 RepID=UPI002FF0573F